MLNRLSMVQRSRAWPHWTVLAKTMARKFPEIVQRGWTRPRAALFHLNIGERHATRTQDTPKEANTGLGHRWSPTVHRACCHENFNIRDECMSDERAETSTPRVRAIRGVMKWNRRVKNCKTFLSDPLPHKRI